MRSERRDPTIHEGLRLFDGTNNDVIVERVAYGGFGVIAIGPNKLSENQRIAYKTLRRELLDDPKAYATFVREGLLWIGLWDHPNITTIYSVLEMGDTQGLRPFIALAYAENGSLRGLLEAGQRQPNGRLPLDLGMSLAQQIAAGLAYLHTPDPAYLRDEPTVHRDLKPENVLLMEDGRAVITDFGLAKIVEDVSPETLVTLAALLAGGEMGQGGPLPVGEATRTTGMHTTAGIGLGTPAYMPPEQWRDARTASTPADIYALGLILSELLTGRHALLDLNVPHPIGEWERAHARPSPRLLRSMDDQIPLAVETLYLRCLAADPSARPSAAEAFATLQTGARALGMEPYEPIQQYSHTPYNELVHWHQWAGACFRFGRFEEALERNDRALTLARQQVTDERGMLPATLSTRGSILKDLGKEAAARGDTALAALRDGQAEVAYREALDAFPPANTEEGRRGRSLVWHQLGVFHNERGRWEQAEAAYVQALAIQPDKPNTYFNRANNLAQWAMHDAETGQREEAIARLRQARVHAVTALGMRYPPATRVIEAIEGLLRSLDAG